MSSASLEPYQAKWFRRQGFAEIDPHIFLDYKGMVASNQVQSLYQGGSQKSNSYIGVLKHDGADVYITTQDEATADAALEREQVRLAEEARLKAVAVAEAEEARLKAEATIQKGLKILNWTRVRHVPTGNTFHLASDGLDGTEEYGDPSNDTQPWSIKWDKN